MKLDPGLKRWLVRGGFALLGVVVVLAAWTGFRVWSAWRSVERVQFNIPVARAAVENAVENPYRAPDAPPPTAAGPTEPEEDPAYTPTAEVFGILERPAIVAAEVIVEPDVLQTFLIIGSDARPTLGGTRADVILLIILPADNTEPIMVSLPRDLYIPNPCTGTMSRINANLNGCGELASGPELMAIAVEDYTGVQVDHFAVFDFVGFSQIVDGVGGVEICVENPVRDTGPRLDLPAGCTLATGTQALSWVRSRKTQEFVDGAWRTMPGVNDLARNQRQQDMLVQALRKLKGFRSVTEFSGLVEDLADTFSIDEGLSLGDAIDTAWDLRTIDPTGIRRPSIPVRFYTTSGGASVLLPTATFQEVLETVYPEAYMLLAEAG